MRRRVALDVRSERRRVALDVTPELLAATGVARYSRELGAALERRDDWEPVRFAVGRAACPVPPGTRHIAVPLRLVHPLWQLTTLPRAEQLTGPVDVVHSLDLVPPPTRRPLVLTVHDLAAVSLPHLHPSRAVRLQRLRLAALSRAAAIVTVSNAVRDEVVALGIAPERVHAAPLGLTRAREPLDPPLPPGRFILAVGTLEPRKGHHILIEAFAKARLEGHRLVLAGPLAGRAAMLEGLAARLGVADRVSILGPVDDRGLAGLYRDATVLCIPSLAEGFGLPALEAMAAGLPVLASDIPVLREVCGEAALFVPPGDADALAGALVQVLTNEPLRSRLREHGRQRAAAFTWDATARATVTAYESALAASSIPYPRRSP